MDRLPPMAREALVRIVPEEGDEIVVDKVVEPWRRTIVSRSSALCIRTRLSSVFLLDTMIVDAALALGHDDGRRTSGGCEAQAGDRQKASQFP